MNAWRGTWLRAQITGIVFGSVVWILVAGLSIPALALFLAVGIVAVAGRNTWAMLWWRYGASPANDFQRETVLSAIVPIASLRGSHQPSIWVGRRLTGYAVMPSSCALVVSEEFVDQVANFQLTDLQAGAIISQALGREQVVDSSLVNVVEAYCVPWRFVQVLVGVVSQFASRHRSFRLSWKVRWIVFGVAIVGNFLNARWPGLLGVIVIAVLSWATGHFQNRWERRLRDLGDQRAIAEGLGTDLRRHPTRRPSPVSTTCRNSITATSLRAGGLGRSAGKQRDVAP